MEDPPQNPPSNSAGCVVCSRQSPIKRCARCHTTHYCSSTCQKSDWNAHKRLCPQKPTPDSTTASWHDKHRKCDDGANHEGKLELITWSTPAADAGGEAMGWGNMLASESEDTKRRFENEMGGDERKLYEYWPQAFRWTCCGHEGDQHFGCDHHGRGSRACSCDFCKMGKAVPNSIHNERVKSAAGRGLRLPRGPDPRSIDRYGGEAIIAETMRKVLGLPDSDLVA